MGMTTLGTRWQISKFWDTWDTLFWESVRNWRNASVARTQTKGRGVTSPCVNPSEQCRIANIQPGHRHSCQAENDMCIYIYLHWINIPKMNYPSFWSVQNFSYIWKHRQHQDVQEDLPGVGCAVTFFLCAFHGQTRADGGTTEVLVLLSDRSTMIYSGAERGSWKTAVSIRSSYTWVIKCPHWTSPNQNRYMVNAMATIRWCPIFPKWDSCRPLLYSVFE